MTAQETQALLTVSLLAAWADGRKHAREGEALQRIAEGLVQHSGAQQPALVDDVMAGRITLAGVVPQLTTEEARRQAYELAVGVCDADGAQSPVEQAFLAELARLLGLPAAATREVNERGLALAPAAEGLTAATPAAPASVPTPPTAPTAANEAELDAAIQQAAVLNGALELLPETLSTLAIIPLQLRLVHRIGQAYGYPMDASHAKDFVAAAGVGLTSQFLERAGRRLLGGLFGGLGRQAASSGLSFAATYALGHVAKRYFASGRQMNGQVVKDAFAQLSQQAQGLYEQHLPAMRDRARTLNPAQVLAMVRGG